MDENLEDLYENLADLDDEEYVDDDGDDDTDEDLDDEEDNIAEDPGDDEDWWHSDEDDIYEVVVNDTSESSDDTGNEDYEYDYDDETIAETTYEPIETVTYTQTTEIESATTGRELFDAIADLLENLFYAKDSRRQSSDILFVTKSEFDALPDEDKYPPDNSDWYEPTGDDDDGTEDEIDLSGEDKTPTVYFIVDAYD